MDALPNATSAPTRDRLPRIRLALRYDPSPAPGGAGTAPLYAALLDHAVAAEARGVDVVWISERPFVHGARVPAALPLCAALAARTSRVRIGVGPLALPLYHPLRVAEDVATLDGLSGGRVELALGLGAAAGAFAGFGVPTRARGDRLEEGIALVRAAFTGGPVTFDGRHHSVLDVPVSPRPVQQPGPPLWIGAHADTAVRRAARLDAGLLAASPEAVQVFLAERLAAGGPGSPARLGLELDPAEVTTASVRRTLDALLDAAHGAACFDLVISAETAGGWLPPGLVDGLLSLRDDLRSGGAG